MQQKNKGNEIVIKLSNGETVYKKKDKTFEYGLGVYTAYTILLPNTTYHYYVNGKLSDNVLEQSKLFPVTVDNKNYTGYLPESGTYNWWIYFNEKTNCGKYVYQVVEFSHMDFIIGFIHVFEEYKIDFRNYVMWAPYTTTKTNQLKHISIANYSMDFFEQKQMVRYGVIPYSS